MNGEIEGACGCGSPGGGGECELSRRAFVGGTLAMVAALLAACGDGQFGAAGDPLAPDGGTPGSGTTVRIADYPSLGAVGGIVRVDTASGAVALVHLSQEAYAAFSMRCPHQGTRVNIVKGGFVCPNHNARFDASGRWTGGQRTSGLVPVPITYAAADGTITIGGTSATAGGPGANPARIAGRAQGDG